MAEEWLEKKKQGAYEHNSLIAWKVHIEKYIVPSFGPLLVQDVDVEKIEEEVAKWNERIAAITRQQDPNDTGGCFIARETL